MIGDSWENDIVGAAGVGMHQVFYNLSGRIDLPFAPTYQITDLKDLFNFCDIDRLVVLLFPMMNI